MSGHLELEGIIIESAHSLFKVLVGADENGEGGSVIQCTIGGKMRKNKINLTNGDEVKIKVSPYDLSRGFITYRL
jgi:translation initiation factor IF-1